ncbi:mitochondrial aspartate-glutamate transporter agc1, partial [Ascosphaera atra]
GVFAKAQPREEFAKHAAVDPVTGERYMSEKEFVEAIAPGDKEYHKIQREQYRVLFFVADRKRTGRLNVDDWVAFEDLLSRPDAEYEVAFRLFDINGTGKINNETFKKLYNLNKSDQTIPFDFDSEWASLYIGGSGKRHDMTYPQFAQMLRGLQGERIRQAFQKLDTDNDGYIDPEDFKRIVLETSRLPIHARFRLEPWHGEKCMRPKTSQTSRTVWLAIYHPPLLRSQATARGSSNQAASLFMYTPSWRTFFTQMEKQRAAELKQIIEDEQDGWCRNVTKR